MGSCLLRIVVFLIAIIGTFYFFSQCMSIFPILYNHFFEIILGQYEVPLVDRKFVISLIAWIVCMLTLFSVFSSGRRRK